MIKSRTIELSILLTILISAVFVFAGAAEPELSPEKGGKIDLGVSTEGQVKKGSLVITNTGDSNLTIEHYMVTCSCLEITSDVSGYLAPGESGRFEFLFDTEGLAGKKAGKDLIIFSNAPNSPHKIKIITQVRSRGKFQANPRDLVQGFSLIVDLRSASEFKTGHIIGAINVQKESFLDWAKKLPEGIRVFIYSEEGDISNKLAREIGEELPIELKSLIGGFQQWSLRHQEFLIEGRE